MIGDLHSDDLGTIESLFTQVLDISAFSRLLNWTSGETAPALHSMEQLGLWSSGR